MRKPGDNRKAETQRHQHPRPNGVRYQIIDMEMQGTEAGPWVSSYRSFTDFLRKYLECLEAGKFTVYDWGIEVG